MKQRQNTIFAQIYKEFGHCQNHHNLTFKRPYQPNNQDLKIISMQKYHTLLLLNSYQIFMFLQGHLHFFLYFVFTLVGQFFLGQALLISYN